MKIYQLKDANGEERYGWYKVTSPWFPEKGVTIYLPHTGLDNKFKDEFIWAVFDKLQDTENALSALQAECDHLRQNHVKRAFYVTELYNKIKDLEHKLENSSNS